MNSSRIIRIGTDCSGIEAPIEALRQLKINHQHCWASDINPYVIQSIKANYNPDIIFGDPDNKTSGDITRRNHQLLPDVDIYVCGFPCQPFSSAGKRNGFQDPRGTVFWSCVETIQCVRPKCFILENVFGIMSHDKGNTFKTIISTLESLKDYTVDWKILNTRDYGIPQNRRRVFIVGMRRSITNKNMKSTHVPIKVSREFNFKWPSSRRVQGKVGEGNWEWKERNILFKYIDKRTTHIDKLTQRQERLLKRVRSDAIFIDKFFLGINTFPNSHIVCPCIVRSNGIWCIPMHRNATVKELLKLQGFRTPFKQVVSNMQIRYQIGNSMSVNVIKLILKEVLKFL